MSFNFDGTNDQLRGTFSTPLPMPLTMAVFYKFTSHPVAIDYYIQTGASAASLNDSIAIRTSTTQGHFEFIYTDTAGSNNPLDLTVASTAGLWTPLVGVATSSTDRRVYGRDTATTVSGTGLRVVGPATYLAIGEALNDLQDYTGLIAEVAVWNTNLNITQVGLYMGGTPASEILPANLRVYIPMSANDLTNLGLDGIIVAASGNAAFNADHPVITPSGGGGSGSANRRRIQQAMPSRRGMRGTQIFRKPAWR